MKKILLLACVFLAFFKTQAQLKVKSNGCVDVSVGHWTGGLEFGIFNLDSSTSMVALYPLADWAGSLGVDTSSFGLAYLDHIFSDIVESDLMITNTLIDNSDYRLKENIKDFENAVSQLNKLRPVTYSFKNSSYGNVSTRNLKEVKKAGAIDRVGLIAQEVQEIFPSMVHLDSSSGYYGVNYIDLIPVLIRSIQEQQIQIDALKYKQQNPDNTKRELEEELIVNATHLEQNFPNPFDSETSVSYFIAPEANSASIMIFDMKGTLLRTYDKLEKGKGEIVIESGQLTPGMYMYSLIVNGVELDNKRMILTE